MALIAVAALAVFSLAMLAVLSNRPVERVYLVPVWVGWLGSWLVIGAFILLPWAKTGGTDAFVRNATWLVDHAMYLDWLHRLPIMHDMVGAIRLDSVEQLRQTLDRPDTSQFLGYVERRDTLFGWQLMRMAWPVNLWLPLAMSGGLAAALLALAASFAALSSGSGFAAKLGVGAGVLAAPSLLVLAGRLPFIDTLGVTNNLAVRLIAILAQVRVAIGGWWMAFGLFLVVCAALLYFLLARSSAVFDRDEERWDAPADFAQRG